MRLRCAIGASQVRQRLTADADRLSISISTTDVDVDLQDHLDYLTFFNRRLRYQVGHLGSFFFLSGNNRNIFEVVETAR